VVMMIAIVNVRTKTSRAIVLLPPWIYAHHYAKVFLFVKKEKKN